ncbi:IMP dehydrogenase [Actinosynnema sp. NPDC050436]|uniref:IMP dehydrogenase n=1 Tax=Actinosynnema sp. NPDC050436 TaxID=3155659 RepID=UPI0033D3605C
MATHRRPVVRAGLSFDDVLLVPQLSRADSRRDVRLDTRLVPGIELALPIISANTPWCTEAAMAAELARLGGCGFLHRMQPAADQVRMVAEVKAVPVDPVRSPAATTDAGGSLVTGAAIGVKDDYLVRAGALVSAGADVLLLDIAHGHSAQALAALRKVKSEFPGIPLVAGNVATAEGTRALIEAGADAVKVGIGPGGICTTRQVAGAGVPQVTAVLDCAEEAAATGTPIIADGGIRSSGDMVKALAAGASTVMLGSMLAGADESAAVPIERDGRRYKVTTGFVTLGVPLTLKRAGGQEITKEDLEDYVAEGVEATFEHRGALAALLKQYAGGIRSGLSYSGALGIDELRERAEFVQVSAAGLGENKPHALDRAPQLHPDYRTEFLAGRR